MVGLICLYDITTVPYIDIFFCFGPEIGQNKEYSLVYLSLAAGCLFNKFRNWLNLQSLVQCGSSPSKFQSAEIFFSSEPQKRGSPRERRGVLAATPHPPAAETQLPSPPNIKWLLEPGLLKCTRNQAEGRRPEKKEQKADSDWNGGARPTPCHHPPTSWAGRADPLLGGQFFVTSR